MVGEWNNRDGIGKTSTLENSLQPQCNCKQGPDMYPAAVNPYPSYGENAESNHVEFSGATNASS